MPDDRPGFYATQTFTTHQPTLPREGEVVADMSKDWTISLLEERLESRIIMTKRLEAEVRSLDSRRIGFEFQINQLKGEVDDARDIANKLADEKNELRKENTALRETLAAERSISNGLSTACCKTKIELREAEAKNAALLKQNEFLHGVTAEQEKNVTSLRAELAKRDETIVNQRRIAEGNQAFVDRVRNERDVARSALNDRNRELARVTADYDAVCRDIDEERRRNENQRRAIEEVAATIASLRSQLGRAGAIEEAAREALAWLAMTGTGAARNPYEVLQKLSSALASPSPGPEVAKPAGDVQPGTEPCTECATSFWAPNPDCEHCMRRHRASEGLGYVTNPAGSSPVIDAAGSLDGNHTHGEFVGWSETAARLAILERVAVAAKAVARAYNLGGMITPMGNLIDALAELDKTEVSPCPSR